MESKYKIHYEEGQLINNVVFIKELPQGKAWSRWGLFLCSCGKTYKSNIQQVKKGKNPSCGCKIIERLSKGIKVTHRCSEKPEYHIWCDIKSRCYNANNKAFKNYGGRGIIVSNLWKNSFEAFYEYIGSRPEGMSLDRINNDGNYEPGNVRWATRDEQNRNKRNNKWFTYKNETKCLKDWARYIGIDRMTLKYRLYTKKMTIEEAIEAPREIRKVPKSYMK